MTNFYAQSASQNLASFTASNESNLNSFLGVSAPPAAVLANFSSLNSYLAAQAPVAPDLSNTWNAYVASVNNASGEADAVVTRNTAQWAQSMINTNLTAPPTPYVPAPALNSSALMFGSLFNQSVAKLVASAPNVFAAVQNSGLGTPSAQNAWNQAVQNAEASTAKGFSNYLPDTCGSVLLETMASGKAPANAGSCSSCITSGLFLHNEMPSLLNPSGAQSLTPASSTSAIVPPGAYSSLPKWEQQVLQQNSTSLSSSVSSALSGPVKPSFSCSSSSTVQSSLSASLPQIFQSLK
jgi:hypothetical protein